MIACLATDVELVWHQSAVEGIHDMILKAMRKFPDEMFLSEISLEALGEYRLAPLPLLPFPCHTQASEGGGASTLSSMTSYLLCDFVKNLSI